MQQRIQTRWQEQQFTAVLVMHDIKEAAFLADRVNLPNNGKVHLDLPISLSCQCNPENATFANLKTQILDRIPGVDPA